ncbi:hypothetical protein ACRAWC_23185 [Leifsonia sp. L25]|uniref:hypothetical protein n=1 Tax=Leifsonia sp. L25 TaxID=3423957 RepID=UPI003D683585
MSPATVTAAPPAVTTGRTAAHGPASSAKGSGDAFDAFLQGAVDAGPRNAQADARTAAGRPAARGGHAVHAKDAAAGTQQDAAATTSDQKTDAAAKGSDVGTAVTAPVDTAAVVAMTPVDATAVVAVDALAAPPATVATEPSADVPAVPTAPASVSAPVAPAALAVAVADVTPQPAVAAGPAAEGTPAATVGAPAKPSPATRTAPASALTAGAASGSAGSRIRRFSRTHCLRCRWRHDERCERFPGDSRFRR